MRFSPIQKLPISKLTKRFEIFYCRHPKYLAGFIQKPGGSKQLPNFLKKCFIHLTPIALF